MRRDYYAVLGIAATAGPREIRQAYRRLARQYSHYLQNTYSLYIVHA